MRACLTSSAVLLGLFLGGCGEKEEPASLDQPGATRSLQAQKTSAAELSLREAVALIAARVKVPVSLPTNLPSARLTGRPTFAGGTGLLTLALPGKRHLMIEYGEAGFDGCGPSRPEVVKVGGVPGVYSKSTAVATLVWPATVKNPEGRYALTGPFSKRRLLAFAESMDRSSSRTPRGPKNGC